jgi:hypothetical protein
VLRNKRISLNPNWRIQMARKPKKVAEDVATPEVVEAAEQAIAVARTRGPRGVAETATITVLVDANPKRAGSKAEAAFALYDSW